MTSDDDNTPAKNSAYKEPMPTKKGHLEVDSRLLMYPPYSVAGAYGKLRGHKKELEHEIGNRIAECAECVGNGDLSIIERMLVSQMFLLDAALIGSIEKMASAQYDQAIQVHASLAIKAHATCRQTVLALAELKNPKAAAPLAAMQVNVHASGENSANELLTAGQNATLDA
jgi:hypothetical protein